MATAERENLEAIENINRRIGTLITTIRQMTVAGIAGYLMGTRCGDNSEGAIQMASRAIQIAKEIVDKCIDIEF